MTIRTCPRVEGLQSARCVENDTEVARERRCKGSGTCLGVNLRKMSTFLIVDDLKGTVPGSL